MELTLSHLHNKFDENNTIRNPNNVHLWCWYSFRVRILKFGMKKKKKKSPCFSLVLNNQILRMINMDAIYDIRHDLN